MFNSVVVPNSNFKMELDQLLKELRAERASLEDANFPHSTRLLDQDIERVDALRTGRSPPVPAPNPQVHLTEKVVVPAKDNPGHNFVGRLLGPRGLSLRRMQCQTGCRMTIMGRGSMKDAHQEEEFRKSDDPKYQHLREELHVLVEARGTESMAKACLASGIAEVRKMLIIGETTDQIRNEQLRELALIKGMAEHNDVMSSATREIDEGWPARHSAPRATKVRSIVPARTPISLPADMYPQHSSGIVVVPRYETVSAGAAALSQPTTPHYGSNPAESAYLASPYGSIIPVERSLHFVPAARSGPGSVLTSNMASAAPRPAKRYHPYSIRDARY